MKLLLVVKISHQPEATTHLPPFTDLAAGGGEGLNRNMELSGLRLTRSLDFKFKQRRTALFELESYSLSLL